MKLKNKKTGEIVDFGSSAFIIDNKNNVSMQIKNLAELNKEWEDYEEPEGWWFIDRAYEPHATNSTFRNLKADKEIGNYFETEEEAKKAVEKLKTWKRLKDKGIEFYGWRRNHTGTYDLLVRWKDMIPRSYEVKKDLTLLFGGDNESSN